MKEWSQSSINTALECARQFYYYRTNAPTVETGNPRKDLGNVIHDAIDKYYKKFQNKLRSRDDITENITMLVRDEWNKYHLPKLQKRRDRAITGFVNFELKRISNPENTKEKVYTEHYFKFNGFKAKVDFYNNGVAIDWKTGKVDKFDRGMMVQGKITQMVIEGSGLPFKHMIFLILGEEKEKFLPLPFISQDTFDKYHNEALEILIKGEYPKNITHLCGYCDYNLHCFLDDKCLWCD